MSEGAMSIGDDSDISFLDVPLPRLSRRRQRVNLYEVLGIVDSELAADRTLAFFLDPNERHGMGTSLIDALLVTLDGMQVLDGTGRTERSLDANSFLGSMSWSVERQVSAQGVDETVSRLDWSGLIDIYLTNRELDIVIIIENKIWAALNNPLESYTRHAVNEGYGTVLLTVLAPREHALLAEQRRWASGTTTYQSLFDALRNRTNNSGLNESDRDRARSTAILEQFEEIRERSQTVTDYSGEAAFIHGFRKALEGKGESLNQFYEAQQQLNRLFRERSQRIGALIDEILAHRELTTIWVAHGGGTSKHWAYTWSAYQFEQSKNSIELILDASPDRVSEITVKAYPGRSYQFYPDLDHVPIGVDWNSTDAEIAEAFVEKVAEINAKYPG